MLDPKAIYEKLVDTGDSWADAEHAASLLEETLRVLKAKLMLESSGSSMAMKEAEAYASEDYKEHVQKMVQARTKANRAKVRWISAQTYSDLSRTKAASERVALREAT